MASKGKKSPRDLAIDALSRISRDRPHPNNLWQTIIDAHDSLIIEYQDLLGDLAERSFISRETAQAIPDATFALIIATAIEQSLELAISTHFVVDDEAAQRMFSESANGPLSTFAAKIKMGYALGIYPKAARDELDLIRHIRNTFAHSWERVNFQTNAIRAACMELQLSKSDDNLLERNDATPKARFLVSARDLYIYLEWDSKAAKKGPMLYASHPGRERFEKIERAQQSKAPSTKPSSENQSQQ